MPSPQNPNETDTNFTYESVQMGFSGSAWFAHCPGLFAERYGRFVRQKVAARTGAKRARERQNHHPITRFRWRRSRGIGRGLRLLFCFRLGGFGLFDHGVHSLLGLRSRILPVALRDDLREVSSGPPPLTSPRCKLVATIRATSCRISHPVRPACPLTQTAAACRKNSLSSPRASSPSARQPPVPTARDHDGARLSQLRSRWLQQWRQNRCTQYRAELPHQDPWAVSRKKTTSL